ncbi:hypothetical protein PsAD2_02732 [Pseudovibrio axinellae]|uniref:DUF1365 domain-containing protein n=1 Tax=Pseudovibrio axinellae TaxID=989403 RepID=A0A165XSN2_9HYPH|nr:DUF1365 domain-containing protein [Pseudovibrio axinellae]KZL17999.1 hypothetical protein PsAD2_02732 [Pseudovibrio axinellae]SER13999.1 hypothetical protein SAMN05421798_106248 [Pseudovibrio axinellae]
MILKKHRQEEDTPLTIYEGAVTHMRHGRLKHKLNYKTVSFTINIDRLPEVDGLSPFLSVSRFNLFSFYPADHIQGGYLSLRSFIENTLKQARIDTVPERIVLLAFPRFLGKVFNPISVFYCYSKGCLKAIVYQVRNTFGDMHHYAVEILSSENQSMTHAYRHSCPKKLHVSPFLEVTGHYDFVARPPSNCVSLLIRLTQDNRPQLTARFQGTRKQPTTSRLLLIALRYFQSSAKVLGLIHFEALKLWLKGAKVYKRPPPPASIVTSMNATASVIKDPIKTAGKRT